MGTDISWEQKVKISALRAACASQFSMHGITIEGQPESFVPEDNDDAMTERILQRARAFQHWLAGTDSHPHVVMCRERTAYPSPDNAQEYSVHETYEEAETVARDNNSSRVQFWVERRD